MERFNKFVSLAWYDGFIEFLFRFVAKTSEPLLAAGLVISAADFLTKGVLMRDNPSLTIAWAWTQALAIESSSGVVFVYALQSFKARDKVKGIAYVILAVLLATTGGAMLLIQLLANTSGTTESALPVQFIVMMAILRVTVSIAYVFLCRAKHIRFSGTDDETNTAPGETSTSISDAQFQQLKALISQQMVSITSVDVPQIAAPGESETDETEEEQINLMAQLGRLLTMSPDITSRDAAAIVGKPHSTVYRHMAQVKQSLQS